MKVSNVALRDCLVVIVGYAMSRLFICRQIANGVDHSAWGRSLLRSPWVRGQLGHSDRFRSSLCDKMIVFDRTATDANRTNHHTIVVDDRHAAGKRNQSIVGVFNSVQRATGLRELADLTSSF